MYATHQKARYWQTPPNVTDNKGLDAIVEKLELIYTTVDWPFKEAGQEVSLFQSGKSRADLWQLAGMVALEETIERGNRACDLDFHTRQQITLLESREKCEVKLTKPLKFQTGRSDCVSDDPDGRQYVTTKTEVCLKRIPGIQTIKLRALSVNSYFFLYIGPANLFWRCQTNLRIW